MKNKTKDKNNKKPALTLTRIPRPSLEDIASVITALFISVLCVIFFTVMALLFNL